MFCPKCGKQLPDNAKFCAGCGSNLTPDAQAAPEQPAPVEFNREQPTPENINQTAPVQPDYNNAPAQPAGYAQQPAPVKPPKKPMSKKTKLAILFSSIGAVVVVAALIVVFAVVIPSLNRVDVSQYISAGFNSDSPFDGQLESVIYIDKDELAQERDLDTFGSYRNFQELAKDGNWNSIISGLNDFDSSDLYGALTYCSLSAYVKGEESDTQSTGGNSTVTLDELSLDDVIVVNVKWEDSSYSLSEIAYYENKLGINFDRTEKTLEYKVSDLVEDTGFEMKEKVELDFFGKLDELNALRIEGVSDGNLSILVDEFSFEQGGYTFERDEDYRYGVTVTDGSGESHDFYINADTYSGISDGDTAKLLLSFDYDEKGTDVRLDDTDVFFKETSKTITVNRNEPLTVDTAKENIDLIESSMANYISKEAFYDTRSIEIKEIYISTPKNADSTNLDFNRLIVVYYEKDDKDYEVYKCDNAYIANGELHFEDSSSEWIFDNDSLDEVKKDSEELNDKDRTVTKIS